MKVLAIVVGSLLALVALSVTYGLVILPRQLMHRLLTMSAEDFAAVYAKDPADLNLLAERLGNTEDGRRLRARIEVAGYKAAVYAAGGSYNARLG